VWTQNGAGHRLGRHFFRQINDRNNKPGRESGERNRREVFKLAHVSDQFDYLSASRSRPYCGSGRRVVAVPLRPPISIYIYIKGFSARSVFFPAPPLPMIDERGDDSTTKWVGCECKWEKNRRRTWTNGENKTHATAFQNRFVYKILRLRISLEIPSHCWRIIIIMFYVAALNIRICEFAYEMDWCGDVFTCQYTRH